MKKIYTVLTLTLMVGLLTSCALTNRTDTSGDASDQADSAVTASGTIDNVTANAAAVSESEAKQAALTHASVDEKDARFLKVEMEKDNGVTYYEVEFLVGDKEYDYEIDANTGKVLACDFEVESQKPITESSDALVQITDEQAKQIALEHAKLNEADVKIVRVRFDYDDGVPEYEVDFFHKNTEYEYEIHANTGKIISSEKDTMDEDKGSGNQIAQSDKVDTTPVYIGKDAAKEKAFSHAGVKASDATQIEVELDRDGSRVKYEVEFNVGSVEYSYEIDAKTGAIIEHEVDRD